MKRALGLSVVLAIAPLGLFAQSPQPAFEAATVRINKSSPIDAAVGGRGGSLNLKGSQLVGENVTLWKLIAGAYGMSEDKDYIIDGPSWLKTERYDVVAKFPADVAGDPSRMRAQLQLMLQGLLAERFKLTLHRDARTVPGYSMVKAKTGFKLQPAEPGPNRTQSGPGMFNADKITMTRFAEFVARFAGRPVDNQTGIDGVYDLKLQWTPDEPIAPDGREQAPSVGPSLFTALQDQLGLKLETAKVQVQILIVDHAEKVPTEN